MANTYWLIEGVDQYEGVEDVKRRVQQAVRGKAKKKQLLTIKHVKKKLAAVTYFKYYSPGRTIVRQHHEAHALYFIISGDVVVSQMMLDELIQQYISVEIGYMHPGDMFGEVSLLHNIPRTATVTTIGHCETLVLMKEDFKNVLQASVQQQWDEVRRAMSAFTYFDALDEVARREGCIVAKMKSYEINETLLGDGVGVPNFVYFILSGRCQMIENMNVIVTTHLGKKFYTLYDPFVPKVESEQDFDTKYFGAYKNLSKSRESSGSAQDDPSQHKEASTVKSGLESILKPTSSMGKSKMSSSIRNESVVQIAAHAEESRPSIATTKRSSSTKSHVLLRPSETQASTKDSIRLSVVPEVPKEKSRPNIKTYFMQVCQFNPGSSFGFGENMRDRRIVALTPVDCMLLPMIWLLQRNTANIWTRIEHYLNKKIPTKKQLFKDFVSERRWQEFREQMVQDVVDRSNTVNYTSVHDVPYSIRMEEMLDI